MIINVLCIIIAVLIFICAALVILVAVSPKGELHCVDDEMDGERYLALVAGKDMDPANLKPGQIVILKVKRDSR